MSLPVIKILGFLRDSGVSDILSKVMDQENKADKLKLKVILSLLEEMDDKGQCDVKKMVERLSKKDHIFDLDLDGFDSVDSD